MNGRCLSECTLAEVQALIGAELAVEVPGPPVSLRLVEVTDLGRRNPDFRAPHGGPVRLECFSLTFAGPAARPLVQGTWSLTRTDRPEPDAVFLVPIQRLGDELRYEAVFF
jgi:hypothetical protein